MVRTQKPNVIVFFTDQQRYDTVGVNGNPCGFTPNFDRMAMEGTHVPLAFTPQPVCGPARAVLQTGKYASVTGNMRNGIPVGEGHKGMAEYFNEAGYQTAYIGKWHLSAAKKHLDIVEQEDRLGYQWWLGANIIEAVTQPYDTTLYDTENQPVHLPGYRSDAITDAAIRYIDAHKENPFFLFVSYLEPHHQNQFDAFVGPETGQEPTQYYIPPDLASLGGTSWQHLSGYYAMVKRLDEGLGRMMDALKSLNLVENTIILFTCDHGCHFKTRNTTYKRSCHESSIRIPMAFTGGPFTGGGRLQELVSLLDIPPTLLDACGIPIPEDMQGRSILPLLHGGEEEEKREIFAQVTGEEVSRCIRTRRWKYAVQALNINPKKEFASEVYAEQFLFDLKYDPYELNNLIHSKAHDVVAKTLREKLKKKIEEVEGKVEIIPAERYTMDRATAYPGEENE